MTQVLHTQTIIATTSTDRRSYSLNIKGLITHLIDILFVKEPLEKCYYSTELSSHMQKDLGLIR